MERGFYVCDSCDLALHLLGPVDRPCPNCGGSFIETDEVLDEPIYHPMQAVERQERKERKREAFKSRDEWAAYTAAAHIDEVVEGFERLLAEHS